MTYVSHAVRSLREDPIPGETVGIVVTVADGASVEAVREELDDLGELRRELAFDRLLATVDHERLDAVCALDGVDAVETEATIEFPS